jgi:hypothetical protein
VQADGLAVPPAPNPTPLGDQIARVLGLTERELVPVQKALRERGPAHPGT